MTGLAVLAGLMMVGGQAGAEGPGKAPERKIKIAGIGAKSGIVRSFGVNSEAVLKAAVDDVNAKGGIKLADGSKAKLELGYFDSRCAPEEAISVLRRLASEDWLVAVGPTCSGEAEPMFGTLQKKVDDASDTGVQFPLFTDTAIKPGLAKISEWAFRDVPSEVAMYDHLFTWLREKYPNAKTLYGGVEEDFAHSKATWYSVMKTAAQKHGFEVLGEQKWLVADTSFTTQVRELKNAKPDVIAISAHPISTCGVLREMRRQHVKPSVLVGLTSSTSNETLSGCAKEAEGMIIPTSFATITDKARDVAKRAEQRGGFADLHSAAAWEIVQVLKNTIESAGIEGKPETVQRDRRRLRDGLAGLKQAEGLLGTITWSPEREAQKPYVFVQAKGKGWDVVYDARTNPDHPQKM